MDLYVSSNRYFGNSCTLDLYVIFSPKVWCKKLLRTVIVCIAIQFRNATPIWLQNEMKNLFKNVTPTWLQDKIKIPVVTNTWFVRFFYSIYDHSDFCPTVIKYFIFSCIIFRSVFILPVFRSFPPIITFNYGWQR